MPTYEYECRSCDHRFEVFQSMTAKPMRKCPECHGSSVSRLLGTGAGLIFKGSGFYQTDYRSADYKKAAEAEKPSAKTSEGKAAPADSKAASNDGKAPSSDGTPAGSPGKQSKKSKGKSSAA